MAMISDRHLTIEKVGKVWVAKFDGKTIASCMTKQAAIQNAEFVMRRMPAPMWRALVA